MIQKNYLDVSEKEFFRANSSGVTVRWLITEDDGATRFAMRLFKVKPGGRIGLHNHPGEHEIYVLSGEARMTGDQGFEKMVVPGDVLFVSPYEKHGCENLGEEPFVFLCVIPILEQS